MSESLRVGQLRAYDSHCGYYALYIIIELGHRPNYTGHDVKLLFLRDQSTGWFQYWQCTSDELIAEGPDASARSR